MISVDKKRAGEIIFECPSCSRGLRASVQMIGKDAHCPSCQSAIQIPREDQRAEVFRKLKALSEQEKSI